MDNLSLDSITDSITLGIVIPVFGSTKSVVELIRGIDTVFSRVCTYHIYLVDDGNPEESRRWLRAHCRLPHVTLICLKKNYGQQNAVLCGIRHAGSCRYIATMDDDLQHSPDTLLTLYRTIEKGFDIVYAVPETEKKILQRTFLIRSIGSLMRDMLFRFLLRLPSRIKVSSFRIMTRELASEISAQASGFFYLSAAVFSRPRKAITCTYPARSRPYGRSGYTFGKLLSLYLKIIRFYGPVARIFPPSERRTNVLYEKSTIMILGGSNCQLHGLMRAREEGYRVILADYTDHPPGAAYAHAHHRTSTFDIEGCIKIAREEHIDAVMTMGTDQPVYTAACIASRLGIFSFLSPEKALAVTNKKVMKQILADRNIPTVPWMLIDGSTREADMEKLAPPLVIKPLDSQGQRGIFKCSGAGQLLSHLPETLSFSRCPQALAESFYPSDEITVSGWVSQGQLTVLTVSDRLLYPDPVHIGICIGHRFPSVHMDRFPEINALSQKVADAFGLIEGPFYLQLLIGEEGIRVNELACRIGGAFEDVVIPYLTGFDILEAVMDLSFGRRVCLNLPKDFRADKISRCAAVQLTFCHPGTIASCTPQKELKKLPFLLDCGYNYHPGQNIPETHNATARFGHGVIAGTPDTIASHIRQFYQTFQVLSPDGKNLVNRLYPQQ